MFSISSMKHRSAFSNNQSMISEPSMVLYACISKGTTVLAEYSNGDQDLGTLASQCLENCPQFHLTFSHTVANRIYCFLIEDPFVYFVIVDEAIGKPQAFQFMERVRDAFMKTSKKALAKGGLDNLKARCFHEEFSPVFRRLLASRELRSIKSPNVSGMLNQNGGADSRMSGKKAISAPLLGGNTNRHSKKKKNPLEEVNNETRDITIENKVDVSDDVNLTRDFSASLQKNGGSYIGHIGRHHAKKMWRRHVWTVLLIDLVICCVLFGVWLYICKGFECIK